MKTKSQKTKKAVQKKPVTKKSAKKSPSKKTAKLAAKSSKSSKAKGKGKTKSLSKQVREGFETIAAGVSALFASPATDLVSAIKKDHEGLRRFIKVMKDTERPMAERRQAASLFSSLLKSHTIAEEKAVYKPMESKSDHELTVRIEEGYVEHTAADRVMADMEKATEADVWTAHANVLAELVEHHLDEEEEEMFPLMKKQIPKNLEPDLIINYLDLRASTQTKITDENAGVLNSFQ